MLNIYKSFSFEARIKQIGTVKDTILCDTSTCRRRKIMTNLCRRNVFNTLYKLPHPDMHATIKLVGEQLC